jgi:hypothetical protein
MSAHENGEKPPAERLDGALGFVSAFLIRGNVLHGDVVLLEEMAERRRALVIEDLELYFVVEVCEELISATVRSGET